MSTSAGEDLEQLVALVRSVADDPTLRYAPRRTAEARKAEQRARDARRRRRAEDEASAVLWWAAPSLYHPPYR
jgi:hypothetical protein